jgi:hypothetical protein
MLFDPEKQIRPSYRIPSVEYQCELHSHLKESTVLDSYCLLVWPSPSFAPWCLPESGCWTRCGKAAAQTGFARWLPSSDESPSQAETSRSIQLRKGDERRC